MIKRINHREEKLAQQIYLIFQASYKVEAKLLQATKFPPLTRTVNDFIECENAFYAYYIEDDIAGIIEIDINNKSSTHIQSLVVYPKFFRQGIGKSLVQFVFEKYKSKIFSVETGLANQPAINLYSAFGFEEVKKWDTEHNVIKIRLETSIN